MTSGRRSPIVPTSPPAAKRIKTDIDAVASETPSSDVPQIATENSNNNNAATTTTTEDTANAKMASLPPPSLQVKKLSDKARLPTRGSAFAAGYDVYAAHDTVIPARGKALVDTDISIAVPADTCKFLLIYYYFFFFLASNKIIDKRDLPLNKTAASRLALVWHPSTSSTRAPA